MKAFVWLCVREREREREGGANKQLMAYEFGAKERERGRGRKRTLEWHRGLRGGYSERKGKREGRIGKHTLAWN